MAIFNSYVQLPEGRCSVGSLECWDREGYEQSSWHASGHRWFQNIRITSSTIYTHFKVRHGFRKGVAYTLLLYGGENIWPVPKHTFALELATRSHLGIIIKYFEYEKGHSHAQTQTLQGHEVGPGVWEMHEMYLSKQNNKLTNTQYNIVQWLLIHNINTHIYIYKYYKYYIYMYIFPTWLHSIT